MQGRKICVTGAAGFIGSHLVERLLAEGAAVVGIDSFHDNYAAALKRHNLTHALSQARFRLEERDIRDAEAMGAVLAGCDGLVHLAALPGVRPSLAQPRLYHDVNVGGTLNLFEVCRQLDLRDLVIASSSSIYGNSDQVPFAEDIPTRRPISIYAATKKTCESLATLYCEHHGFDIICLRFFTVFGPRQRPDLAIHKFCRLLLAGEPLPFFGDGSTARDYTYIDDIVTGTLAALTTNRGAGLRICNLGSDRPVRLDALVAAIENATGRIAVCDRQDIPRGDVNQTWADLTRARQLLGYEPTTSLATGLENFVAWYRDSPAATA